MKKYPTRGSGIAGIIPQQIAKVKKMDLSNIVKASLAIQTEVAALEMQNREMVERNLTLRKALATIKTSLERGVKQPQNLSKAIYESIDLARSLTPYTEMSTGETKIDPPMSDEEKTLP